MKSQTESQFCRHGVKGSCAACLATSQAGERTQIVYKKYDSSKAVYIFIPIKYQVNIKVTNEQGEEFLLQTVSRETAKAIGKVLIQEGYFTITI